MQHGDAAEVKELIRLVNSWVYNPVLVFLKNREDTEEVVQDTALKVLGILMAPSNNTNTFRKESSLKTWVYSIALNKSRDYFRYKNQQKRKATLVPLENKDSTITNGLSVNSLDPGEILENREAVDKLWQLIYQLPDNQQEVIVLVKVDHNSIQETANMMNLSYKAVESLMSRAKNNLKTLIRKT